MIECGICKKLFNNPFTDLKKHMKKAHTPTWGKFSGTFNLVTSNVKLRKDN
jgi:hypothetical protein